MFLARTAARGIAVCGIVLLMGAQTVAAATAPAVMPITRAQFCVDLAGALGLSPVFPAVPDFQDVPSSAPDYGYIEAVFKAGWVSGIKADNFDPNGSLTRIEVAKIEVLALGDGVAAAKLADQSTSFTDNAALPAWGRGYIAEAVALSLISGYPDGAFRPEQSLTSRNVGDFLSKLVFARTATAYTMSVSSSVSVAAVGQDVSLSATVETQTGSQVWGASVTFATDSSGAVISGHSFIASAPGDYTVTGSYAADGHTYTGTTTITVSGPPASIKIDAPSVVSANGTTQTQVLVDVLDANGNLAVKDTGSTITLSVSGNALASSSPLLSSTTVGGVASFTLTDGSIPGGVTALRATDTAITGPGGSASVTVSAASQVPATVVLTAPSEFTANTSGTTATVELSLLDNSGQHILTGMYPLTVSIAGPATFLGGSTSPETVLYSGNGQSGVNAAYAVVAIQDEQGQTGMITVSVTGPGIPVKSTTIAAVIGGVPNQLAVTEQVASVSRDASAKGITFKLSSTDQNGLSTATTVQTPVLIAVYNPSGGIATDFTVDGQPQGTTGYLDGGALLNGGFTITDPSGGSDLGSYRVQVSEPNGTLVASRPVAFKVTPGVVAGIVAHLAATGLWTNNPTTTLTVQAVDADGNPVADAGIPILLASASGNQYPVAFFASSGVTDAKGLFTVTVQAVPKLGPIETIDVTATIAGKAASAFPEPVFIVETWGP